MQKKNILEQNSKNLILLSVFLFAAVILFFLEYSLAPIASNNVILFRALEFLLSIVIGFYIKSIVSIGDFERNLKKYAISAYRRIFDIRRSVKRIHIQIEQILNSKEPINHDKIKIILAIADELTDTVSSSGEDWSDIIGSDISKIKRIKELKESLLIPPASGEFLVAYKNIEHAEEVLNEIDKLRSDLPNLLQATVEREDVFPREGRQSQTVASALEKEIASRGSVDVPFNYLGNISDEIIQKLQRIKEKQLITEVSMFKIHLGLVDGEGDLIAEVINPFNDTDIYHNDYIVTLLKFIRCGVIEVSQDGAPPALILQRHEVIPSDIEGVDFLIRIPIPKG